MDSHDDFVVLSFWVFLIGSALVYVASMWANHQDRRDGKEPESPTVVYALFGMPALVLLILFVGGKVVDAAIAMDPCAHDSSWWWRVIQGCWGASR